MQIEINDMFRLQRVIKWPAVRFWFIEEWSAGPTIVGKWKPHTRLMRDDDMDRLLERMQCPAEPHARFREAVQETKGTETAFQQAGAQRRVFPLETSPPKSITLPVPPYEF
ncbi:hypothetical protein Q6D67_20350 [Haliea sp. E1-2-M8]|uniref:hypothetical protein n=1 Tax=Haliea sp. E1-2-M8 TaxID=3064706 RepID=UPI0027260B1A|nr:hypothetical protein [Haliea sp. E1-2-M8]MDO8864042.1 hypothetical protein [Haliea sp. E1-2-M8]